MLPATEVGCQLLQLFLKIRPRLALRGWAIALVRGMVLAKPNTSYQIYFGKQMFFWHYFRANAASVVDSFNPPPC
jgi:hypothetical protein